MPSTEYETLKLLSNSKFRYCNPLYFFKLKRIIKEKKISHLIIEHPYYGWLGIALQKFTGVKLIVHSHNIEALRFRSLGKWWWRILWVYEKMVHGFADLNFFISQEDREYAIGHYKLPVEKCTVITYGTTHNEPPAPEVKSLSRAEICLKHNIQPEELLLLYYAAFNYQPNIQGLEIILKDVNPILQHSGIAYKIIICGGQLPERYNQLAEFKNKNIIYAGFVENIDTYTLGADIFLNPIAEGGGIKTKLVESLAANTHAISFQNGALGIPKEIAGKKLIIVPDLDAEAMVKAIRDNIPELKASIPSAFYAHFYWGNITQKAYHCLSEMI